MPILGPALIALASEPSLLPRATDPVPTSAR